jgi:hypothetical protein
MEGRVAYSIRITGLDVGKIPHSGNDKLQLPLFFAGTTGF